MFTLDVKNRLALLDALIEALSGDARLSLEGNLSRCADKLRQVAGISEQETIYLKRNTLQPRLDFVVLPIETDTKETIRRQILPHVGIQSRVIHVQIERSGKLEFGAYDNFEKPFVGDGIPEEFLKTLVETHVLKGYQRIAGESVDRPR